MKYKTMMEIMKAEDLSLTEMQEAIEQYLKEKNMTMDEFIETEEGQEMLKMSEEARFTQT